MNEFSLIAEYFAPLAGREGLGLRDDAALLAPPPGCELVITQDAMTAGVHFFADDPPDLIARKLLRVNLSDLAAKGATSLGYLLSLLLPESTSEEWIKSFAAGLAADQAEYGLRLFGGDTSRIHGPLTLSLTAIGSVPAGGMLRRSGAQPGDGLFVTGTIGDAALGLKIRLGELAEDAFLLNRYLLPQPRFGVVSRQSPITSAMDVSDGLVQDAGHLAAASGVKLVIEAEKVPLSPQARAFWQQWKALILTGGDDYEILFTTPASSFGNATRIGHVEQGSGVEVRDAQGAPMQFATTGWQHFR